MRDYQALESRESWMFVAFLAAGTTCQPVQIEGTAVIGFEASYVVPARGDLRQRKIWVQIQTCLPPASTAPGRSAGCGAVGQ